MIIYSLFLSVLMPQTKVDSPYALLREAYLKLDPVAATSAYADNAVYKESFAGFPSVTRTGKLEIQRGFASIFESLAKPNAETKLDVNFRITATKNGEDTGFYRLRVGHSGEKKVANYYGSFNTKIVEGKFAHDSSSDGTITDFENAAGQVLINPDDETLDASYYDQLLGEFVNKDGISILITRSGRRLWALNGSTNQWRGLTRESGMVWRAPKDYVLGELGSERYVFSSQGRELKIVSSANIVALQNSQMVKRELVQFRSGNLMLSGDILRPKVSTGPMPAVVLIHGSGGQDRHGYASVIELIAMQFVRSGYVALIFDKRGVGLSEGDLGSAGFPQLAEDVRSAEAYLRSRSDVRKDFVGYAGSSQAGWIAARAIADKGKPAFVFLLGAAGGASSVEEQNIYNTRIRMEVANVSLSNIKLALDQQRAFFAARRDSSLEPYLAKISELAGKQTELNGWLFPATAKPDPEPDWFDVLDPDFNPLPIWRNYKGKSLFVFSKFDDSTDTSLVTKRLMALPNSKSREVKVLPKAQHLGLLAKSVMATDFERVSSFDPSLWPQLRSWARRIASNR
jgi:pimeloyl-ACP methyl ester carboxylesterase